jgi:hypothetical protein
MYLLRLYTLDFEYEYKKINLKYIRISDFQNHGIRT